jgi:outer membrane protein assembly factor BamD
MHSRSWTYLALAAVVALTGGCRRGFRISQYPTNESLFAAGVREFQKEHWGNAIASFEKLTNDLPARDTLLPRSYWYLAQAHGHQREHLLAAQAFSRLFESFPDDTLSDDGAYQAGLSYRKLWRKPALDPTYGELALSTFNTLLGLYPDSPHGEAARQQIVDLEQWFATKEYETGMFYVRSKAWDSAIIYFQTVVARWPHVPRAKDALLRLAESYRTINYRENVIETCARLRESYPGDLEVTRICRGTPAAAAVADSTARPRPTPPGD